MSEYLTVEFQNGIESTYRPAFDSAAAFWNNVISSGHAGETFTQDTPLSPCGLDFSIKAGDFIRGLRIYSQVVGIDGTGGILGQAGPCLLSGNFPMVGIMQFDSADSQGLIDDGQFEQVIVHEMGHVVGIGGLWGYLGFVDNACGNGLFGVCRGDPTYNGAAGREGFLALGGGVNEDLLVGNERGPGTWDAHWREETFVNELMTGFLDQGMPNPLSIMTVLSLKDIGYSVNLDSAEDYSIPSVHQRPFFAPKIELFGDILDFDVRDFRDIDVGSETVPENALEIDDDSDLTNEFGGLFALMIIGFLAMAAMMNYYSKNQREALANLASSVTGPSDNRVGTKNNIYIEP